tara:strand:+ start:280 stop:555 length:276 start_codon:yes stop_codon:yes gene_type:complete
MSPVKAYFLDAPLQISLTFDETSFFLWISAGNKLSADDMKGKLPRRLECSREEQIRAANVAEKMNQRNAQTEIEEKALTFELLRGSVEGTF